MSKRDVCALLGMLTGSSEIVAFGIFMRLLPFCSSLVLAITNPLSSVVITCISKRDWRQMRNSIWYSGISVFIISSTASVVFLVLGSNIISVWMHSSIEYSLRFRIAGAPLLTLNSLQLYLASLLTGTANTRSCRNVHIAQASVVVPLSLLLFYAFGQFGILAAIDSLLALGSLFMLHSLRIPSDPISRRQFSPLEHRATADTVGLLDTTPAPFSRRLRVCVISHSYLDAENRKNIHALQQFHCTTAILPRNGPSILGQKVEYAHPDCDSFVSLRAIWPRSGQYLFLSLRLKLNRLKPDIVLLEGNPWSLAFLQILIAKKLARISCPTICVVKKNTYREYKGIAGLAKDVLVRTSLSRTHRLFVVSRKACDMLQDRLDYPSSRMFLCPQFGVDTTTFVSKDRSRAHRNSVRVGYCGRLDEDKGVLDLIEAVRLARELTSVDIELELTGTGAFLRRIIELADSTSWLHYRGVFFHSDIRDSFQRLDIFVLASKPAPDHEEHDAQALIEAMATGLPCIASRVGIIPELLDSRSGVLVPPGQPLALARAIADLVMRPEGAQALGRNAREWVCRNWSLEAVARRKAEFLSAALRAGEAI